MGNDSRYRMTYGSTETEPPVEHYELRRALGAPYAQISADPGSDGFRVDNGRHVYPIVFHVTFHYL